MDKSKWTDRLPDLMEGYTEAEPEGLWDAVRAGITPRRRRVAAAWWYAAGSLAAAAAVVLAVFLWPQQSATTPQVSPVPENLLAENTDVLPAGEENRPETHTEAAETPVGEQKGPETHTEAAETPVGEQKGPETHTEAAEAPVREQKGPETHTEAAETPVREQNEPETHTETEEHRPVQEFWPDGAPSTRSRKGGKVQLSVTSGGLLAQAGTVTRNGFGLPDSPAMNTPVAAPRALFSSVHRNKSSSTESRHWQNFRAGVLVNYAFSPRWSLETGVQFTSLQARSTTQSGNGSVVENRRFNYLGIPLNIQFKPLEFGPFSLYLSAGPMYEFLLGGRESSQTFTGGMLTFEEEPRKLDLRDHRWSLNGGVGVQWQPVRFAALFVQPGVSWHFPGGENAPETFYSARPVAFDLIFGARILLQ